MVEEEKRGIRRVNRPRWEGGNKRYIRKLLQRKNWYKRGKGKTEREEWERDGRKGEYRVERQKEGEGNGGRESMEPETVMFIPSTPRGELLNMLKETDRDFRKGTNIKPIKFIE